MKRSPLLDKQHAAGADFIEFAEYETPNSFGDTAAEYNAIRKTAAIL